MVKQTKNNEIWYLKADYSRTKYVRQKKVELYIHVLKYTNMMCKIFYLKFNVN